MSINNKPVQGITEALGYRDSELLSSIEGQTIIISQADFETRKDKDQKDYENVYIVTAPEGKVYRASNMAVLNKLHKISEDEAYPVRAKVSWRKSTKKGAKPYLDLVDPDQQA